MESNQPPSLTSSFLETHSIEIARQPFCYLQSKHHITMSIGRRQPPKPRDKGCKLRLGIYKVLMERMVVYNFGSEGAHLIGSRKFQCPFKESKLYGGQSAPPPKPVIPQRTSDQNFKRTILFSIVERSGNYVLVDVNLSTVLRVRT